MLDAVCIDVDKVYDADVDVDVEVDEELLESLVVEELDEELADEVEVEATSLPADNPQRTLHDPKKPCTHLTKH